MQECCNLLRTSLDRLETDFRAIRMAVVDVRLESQCLLMEIDLGDVVGSYIDWWLKLSSAAFLRATTSIAPQDCQSATTTGVLVMNDMVGV